MALLVILNETKSLKSRFFMVTSVSLRMTVHARSLRGVENDEAISSTQGDCFTSFAMTPLNGSLRGVENDEAIYHYTEGLLHFVRNDTPQRVIARS